MDFWSRLIGGYVPSASSRESSLDGPQQRLTTFKRTYLQLQQSWQKTGRNQADPAFGATVVPRLQSINNILRDEIHTPAPHLCIQNVATAQLYVLLSSVGVTVCNEQATKEILRFFGLLVDTEDEDFINDTSFADRLIVFVQAVSSVVTTRGFYVETEIAELLFATAAKLRQQSEVPPAWFRPSVDAELDSLRSARIPIPKSQEFPLVFLLLDYVHYDGEVGDFARTGLLYILESAGRSYKLEKWIIESELATMMASGLGALYSQLSSKVALTHASGSVPPILTFSNVMEPVSSSDAEPIFTTALQGNLATFLSYLAFWQDMLERCPSVDIKATLLDHFDFLFLRPLLYPSIVESSDIDSGSSVAVMTYLRSILENVTHTDIIRLLLHFMLGNSNEQQQDTRPSRPAALARRRKSETLITKYANRGNHAIPELLTLTNILQGYLASRSHQTVTASLRLLCTILRSWHDMASTQLFRAEMAKTAGNQRSIEIHDQHLDTLYSTAEDILDEEDLELYYESHLQDAQVNIELHSCFVQQFTQTGSDCSEASLLSKDHRRQHVITAEDPLLTRLLSLLEDFLVNDIEINLSLSETFAALASCSETSLEGWLLVPKSTGVLPRRGTNAAQSVDGPTVNNQATANDLCIASPVLARLRALVERIDKLRADIQDFDIYLSERRHVFRVGEEIDEVVAEVPIRRSQDMGDDQNSKPREKVAAIGLITERLKTSSHVSRASSPRGRQPNNAEHHEAPPISLVRRLNQLRLSPSRSPSKILERHHSPSPLRKTSISSRRSSALASPRGPPDMLQRKIRMRANIGQRRPLGESTDSETGSIRSESTGAECDATEEMRELSLSHILTNVIILQEFILELAAIIQVRASLFGEVHLD
ncbi:MAG: hypothetical protein LQ339_001339 [Xanthoria mediterranea]|nr:MAG: hypothetical protein LQ339_001339 [Xanthoria mediterranea]